MIKLSHKQLTLIDIEYNKFVQKDNYLSIKQALLPTLNKSEPQFDELYRYFLNEMEMFDINLNANIIRFLTLFIPLGVNYKDNPNNRWLLEVIKTDIHETQRLNTIYKIIGLA